MRNAFFSDGKAPLYKEIANAVFIFGGRFGDAGMRRRVTLRLQKNYFYSRSFHAGIDVLQSSGEGFRLRGIARFER